MITHYSIGTTIHDSMIEIKMFKGLHAETRLHNLKRYETNFLSNETKHEYYMVIKTVTETHACNLT